MSRATYHFSGTPIERYVIEPAKMRTAEEAIETIVTVNTHLARQAASSHAFARNLFILFLAGTLALVAVRIRYAADHAAIELPANADPLLVMTASMPSDTQMTLTAIVMVAGALTIGAGVLWASARGQLNARKQYLSNVVAMAQGEAPSREHMIEAYEDGGLLRAAAATS